jgi:hypothetical protein
MPETPPSSVAPPEALFSLVTDAWTAPFWEAARQRRLTIPRCAACGTWRMPPTPFCPACQTKGIDWQEVAPEGRLYSWTVVTRAPGMALPAPYIPAVVALPQAGGVRLVAAVIGARAAELWVDQPVDLVWETRSDDVVVPRFTPSHAADRAR